jgi:ribosomal protein S20
MKSAKVLMLVGCLGASVLLMAASGGCGSDLHKADVASGAIAASLHSMATVNHTNELETAEERAQIANYITQAATANETLIGVLQVAENNGGKIDTASALAAFQKVTAQIDQLNDQGILHIKNAQAQANFALAISSIQAEIATIESLIGTPTAENHFPRKHPFAPMAAAIFTPAEIEELIALAIAAGSTLIPKLLALRGQSDPEILAAASEDDKAAIAIAESDGADAPAAE